MIKHNPINKLEFDRIFNVLEEQGLVKTSNGKENFKLTDKGLAYMADLHNQKPELFILYGIYFFALGYSDKYKAKLKQSLQEANKHG